MNEIANCPICGGVPLDKWEVTSVRVFQTGQTCCGVDCNTNERWNQYAAAMNAEARHNELVEAVVWEREFDEALVWLVQTGRYPRDMAGKYDLANERECARAEVGRLIEEGEG